MADLQGARLGIQKETLARVGSRRRLWATFLLPSELGQPSTQSTSRAPGSPTTTCGLRRTIAEYTEDLFAGFSDPRGAKVCAGATASLGRAVGELLVRRIVRLGAVCVLHGDTKPENALLRCRSRGRQEDLRDLGSDCLAGALKGLGPRALPFIEAMPGALFSILNLILFWTLFEVDAEVEKRRSRKPATSHEVLTNAPTRSSFPLDLVGPNLPTPL